RCLRVLRCLPWALLVRPRGDRLRLARPRPRLPDQVRRRLGDAASADLTQQARVVLAAQCEKSSVARSPQTAVAPRRWISRNLDDDHTHTAAVLGEPARVV